MLEGFATFIGALVIFAAVEVGTWLLSALYLMLAVGDIHRNWWPQVPLLGFQGSLGISWCLAAFLGITVVTSAGVARKK